MNGKNGLTGELARCSRSNALLCSGANKFARNGMEQEVAVTMLGALVLGVVLVWVGIVALRRKHPRVWLGLMALGGALVWRALNF